jgi:predicted nucleic acid-binding protein
VRVFLDTNVLVYAVDEAEVRRRAIARELLARGAGTVDSGFVVSTQVLSEFLVAVRRLEVPVHEDLALALVREIASSVEVHVPSVADVVAAAERAARDRLHHFDALIVQAAISSGCDLLLTEDLQHGRRFDDVTVTDPFR